jgi:Type I restriction enzyme R protein N terminus (HSDR_N)
MLFPPIDLSKYSEADVRAEIIDRLLAYLGYRSGTENNVVREFTLRYPKISLGRHKGSDPLLQGRADYIVEVRDIGRWTIEAKPSSREISSEDIEQAYTYAAHHEVQAFFYALCNGVKFYLFRTFDGPRAPPLFEANYSQLDGKLQIVSNLLSPVGFARVKRTGTIDIGEPLASGLGSSARIVGGHIQYRTFRASVPIPSHTARLFDGYKVQIASGQITRDENGRVLAEIRVSHFHKMLELMSQQLGLEGIRYFCSDRMVSRDSQSPAIFEGTNVVEFKKGQMLFDVANMQPRELLVPGKMTTFTEAIGVLQDNQFVGKFFAVAIWKFEASLIVNAPIVVELEGTFLVRLH